MRKAHLRPDRPMDVSLIICTRNRCQQLARCLSAVRCIAFERPWELIIVDNGSVDDTAGFIREFVRTAPFPVTYVLEPRPGLGCARNAGLRNSSGEILAFTDDDCYPAHDFLEQVWLGFRDLSVGYITGRVMLHDPSDSPQTINELKAPLTFPGRYFHRPADVLGANMAFRRRVLLQLDGFDPLFGAGALLASGEDLDAAGRASAAGWIGQYRPEVVVSHHHGRKASDLTRLRKAYDIGRGAYHMKLLLKGHEFLWFARSLYEVPRRFKWYRGAVFWEAVGAVKYLYAFLAAVFRSGRTSASSRTLDHQEGGRSKRPSTSCS